ncbi:hypothetical protein FDECE_9055 [Fusarium decemcellulare]|nr:hypothetical protein FDECE_9055 [Fusarium decemcellulare]
MATNTPNVVLPKYPDRDHSVHTASVAIAVDVSSSTAGPALAAEKKLVSRIAKRLSVKSQLSSLILPWSGIAHDCLGLNSVDTLTPQLMTRPVAILENETHLAALSRSSLWILLTDGEVSDPKGAFKSLLKGADNPVINRSTTWQSLPRLSLYDLAKVVIPIPKRLESHQIALQGSLVVNIDDLLNDKLSPDTVTQILADDDNLGSIIMTLQSRNQTDPFQAFINRQAIALDDPLFQKREDIDGQAVGIYTELCEAIHQNKNQRHFYKLQEQLREAHSKNMRTFLLRTQDGVVASAHRQATIRMASARSETSRINHASSLSSTASYARPEYEPGAGGYDNGPVLFSRASHFNHWSAQTAPERPARTGTLARDHVPRYYTRVAETWKSWVHQVSDPQLLSLLYTPGFNCKTGSFTGTCPICDGKDRILAWLFRSPAMAATPEFPAPDSFSSLAFPLAMGFFVETDVVSSTICCESCSVCAVAVKLAPAEDNPIVAALPMVPYVDNAESYRKLLQHLFANRFAEADLAQVFMSALCNAAVHLDSSDASALFRSAFQWTMQDLMVSPDVAVKPIGLLLPPGSNPPTSPMRDILPVIFSTDSISPFLMQYPLHGFMVLVQVARAAAVPLAARKLAVFRRFLYTLTEELVNNVGQQTVRSPNANPAKPGIMGRINHLLWSYEWMTQSSLQKTPKESVPFAALRGTVLPESTCDLLNSIDDAKFLNDPVVLWVGRATAVYLHALDRSTTEGTLHGSAWELFNGIVCKELCILLFYPASSTTENTVS